MTHKTIILFIGILIFLLCLSAFFSCAETGLMALNRYRIRHKAKLKKRYAILILKLLKRPDQLLGTILIGNNFANIFASALATLLAAYYWGEQGAIIATTVLAFVVLIIAEVAPKTIAAFYPNEVAKLVVWPIYVFLKLFYPLVWFANAVSNNLLKLFRIKITHADTESITREELRTIVYETSGRFSREYQAMLLGILDLNKITVSDVMVPKSGIVGIDVEASWEATQHLLANSHFDWLPVYRENINQILGVIHIRELMHLLLAGKTVDSDVLIKLLHEAYFIPEGTPLNIQLIHFQQQRRPVAFVVDEYGNVQGLVTVVDILEEIVGEFTTSVTPPRSLIQTEPDGSYLVNGAISIREFNRLSKWKLPTKQSKTLSGLIIDYLESLPESGVTVLISGYPIEIIEAKENRVKLARIYPPIK